MNYSVDLVLQIVYKFPEGPAHLLRPLATGPQQRAMPAPGCGFLPGSCGPCPPGGAAPLAGGAKGAPFPVQGPCP